MFAYPCLRLAMCLQVVAVAQFGGSATRESTELARRRLAAALQAGERGVFALCFPNMTVWVTARTWPLSTLQMVLSSDLRSRLASSGLPSMARSTP